MQQCHKHQLDTKFHLKYYQKIPGTLTSPFHRGNHALLLLYIVSNHINPAGNYRNRYIQSACSLYLLCRCSRQPISVYSLFRELVLHTCRLQNEFQNRKENQLLSSGNDSYVTGDICINIIYKTACNCRCIWGNCSFRNWNDFGKNSDL